MRGCRTEGQSLSHGYRWPLLTQLGFQSRALFPGCGFPLLASCLNLSKRGREGGTQISDYYTTLITNWDFILHWIGTH